MNSRLKFFFITFAVAAVVVVVEVVERVVVDALDDRDNVVEVEIVQKNLEPEVADWMDIEEVVPEVALKDTEAVVVVLEKVEQEGDTLEETEVEVAAVEVDQADDKTEVDRECNLEVEHNMEEMDMEMVQIEDGEDNQVFESLP